MSQRAATCLEAPMKHFGTLTGLVSGPITFAVFSALTSFSHEVNRIAWKLSSVRSWAGFLQHPCLKMVADVVVLFLASTCQWDKDSNHLPYLCCWNVVMYQPLKSPSLQGKQVLPTHIFPRSEVLESRQHPMVGYNGEQHVQFKFSYIFALKKRGILV